MGTENKTPRTTAERFAFLRDWLLDRAEAQANLYRTSGSNSAGLREEIALIVHAAAAADAASVEPEEDDADERETRMMQALTAMAQRQMDEQKAALANVLRTLGFEPPKTGAVLQMVRNDDPSTPAG